MSAPTVVAPVDTLRLEITAVELQLARIDTKAGLLLGLTGAASTAGPVVVTGAHLAAPAAVVAWLAVAAFVTAAAMLALAVRPMLGTRSQTPHGFARYAGAEPQQILAELDAGQAPAALAGRLSDLAATADAKYRRIRVAVDVVLAGIGCAVLAALVAAVVG